MYRLFVTDPRNTALLVQRLVLAGVIFPHGAQKLFGWFGGHGFDATLGYLSSQGVPVAIAFLVIMAETVGAALLALGLTARLAALGIACNMVGAIATVHWPHGFFMNWSGAKAGEGFEFHLLALGLAIPLAIWGAGRWSIDTYLARSLERRGPGIGPAHAVR